MANLGSLFNNGSQYNVKAIEFHTPSEHAFEANNQNQAGMRTVCTHSTLLRHFSV